MEHEVDNNTNCDRGFLYSNHKINKGTGGLGGWRTSGDYLNYDIIDSGQNTEKSPEDLRRIDVKFVCFFNN